MFSKNQYYINFFTIFKKRKIFYSVVIKVFMKSPKRVWSRDLILEKIWEIDFIGDTKTVDVHVRWLREKLEEDPSAPKLLKTVRGFGYKFG